MSDNMVRFEQDLQHLINKHGIDNECKTPDYILSDLIKEFLQAYAVAMVERNKFTKITLGE